MMRGYTLTLAACIALSACSTSSTSVSADVADTREALSETTAELASQEIPQQDLYALDLAEDAVDVGAEVAPACTPGSGCFLDPCDEPADCLSGLCVEHMGDLVCSQTCVEECPDGWQCRQTSNGPDVFWACFSPFAFLCRPCGAPADCEKADGISAACVSFGPAGSFCGADCSNGGLCPEGFSCVESETVAGGTAQQCVPDSGACDCSKASVAMGLATPCYVENGFGRCDGVSVCTGAGLEPCDAATPVAETCNGVDDDCDGVVDNVSCDDGNACTEDSCVAETGCVNEPLTGTECADGNVCTLADHCDSGACVGTPIACEDDNPCTDDACNPTGGCVFTNNAAKCDDLDPCTVADACEAGQCLGFPVACDCAGPGDPACAALDDGNLCNGALYCNTDTLPFLCATDPATVVTCQQPEGPHAFCLESTCNPDTGACVVAPDHEGLACDDGDACTLDDRCQQGVCAGDVEANCTDGNLCTDDSCDPAAGCLNVPNTLPCFDGSFCTQGDSCGGGSCQPGPTEADCNDGNPCTTDSCDPVAGCVHTPNTLACDDGNACTAVDTCAGGKCVGVGAVPCNDSNPCTTDTCEPDVGCVFSVNDAPCTDGNVCTTGDHCHLGGCISSGVLPCDDGNACTDDQCKPLAGCEHLPNSLKCDDGNACTVSDTCSGGACKGASPLDCDDANPCTKDACDILVGCTHGPQAGACTDSDPCTINDACANGQCVPGPQDDCGDGNVCTDDECGPAGICIHTPNSAPCDDGNACTLDEACSGGTCGGGSPKPCDDSNPCTTDGCMSGGACLSAPLPDLTPCGDWPWRCKAGKCACVPDCDGKDCGDDGCGGSCGPCAPDLCVNGVCQCMPQCQGFVLPWGTWGYVKVLTIPGSKVAADVTGFPVLVNLPADPDLAAHAGDNGFDLLFTTPQLVKLDHEVEQFSGDTGALAAWVRTDLKAGKDTPIYLYYGNPASPDQAKPAAVWDANYVGVWHMKELNAKDSTTNANHLTAYDGAAPDAVGLAGPANRLVGGSSRLHRVASSTINQALAGNGTVSEHYTVSAWFRPDQVIDAASAERIGLVAYGGPFYLAFDWVAGGQNPAAPGRIGVYTVDYPPGTHNLLPGNWSTWSKGTWYYVVATFDRPTKKLYVFTRGGPSETVANTWNQELQDWWCDGLYIGRNNNSFAGAIDEVRISRGPARTAEWITTEFNNQSDPAGFVGVGKEHALRGCGPDACGKVCGTCALPNDPCTGGLCTP